MKTTVTFSQTAKQFSKPPKVTEQQNGFSLRERLLSRNHVAERLNISPRTFSRYKAKLIALGLQPAKLGQYEKFREASVDGLIQQLIKIGGLQ